MEMEKETVEIYDFTNDYDTDNSRFIVGIEGDNHFLDIAADPRCFAGICYPICIDQLEQYSEAQPKIYINENSKDLYVDYSVLTASDLYTFNDFINFWENIVNSEPKISNIDDVKPYNHFIEKSLKNILNDCFDNFDIVNEQQDLQDSKECLINYVKQDPVTSFFITKIISEVAMENPKDQCITQQCIDKIKEIGKFVNNDFSYEKLKEINELVNVNDLLNENIVVNKNTNKNKI